MTNGPIKKSTNPSFLNAAKRAIKKKKATDKAKRILKKKGGKKFVPSPSDNERIQREAKRRDW